MLSQTKDLAIVSYWSHIPLTDQIEETRRYHQKIAARISSLPSGLILDAGSGIGRFTKFIRNDSRAVALDLVFQNCQKTAKVGNIDTVCGDVRKLPFRDKVFDNMISIQVFGSFQYPEIALKEYSRVLVLSGKALVTFLNSRTLYYFWNVVRGKRSSNRLSVKKVCELSERASLQPISVEIIGIPIPARFERRMGFADRFMGNDILLLSARK